MRVVSMRKRSLNLRTRSRYRSAAGVFVVLAVCAFALGPWSSSPASAVVRVLTLETFPTQPGAVYVYQTSQVVQTTDTYITTIHIRERQANEFTFDYAMYGGRVLQGSAGTVTNANIDGCERLDPWWHGGTDRYLDRCDMWLARDRFAELTAEGETHFAVDTVARNDRSLPLRLEGYETMTVVGDNGPVEFWMVVATNDYGDTLYIYDDPEFPLIVAAKVANVYEWRMTHAHASFARAEDAGTELPPIWYESGFMN